MFTIKQKSNYFWPVNFEVPKSGGGYEKMPFSVEFKRLSATEISALRDRMGTAELPDDAAFCREVVTGWRDIKGDDGADLVFSPENLGAVLDVHGVAAAVVIAFFDSINTAKRKN